MLLTNNGKYSRKEIEKGGAILLTSNGKESRKGIEKGGAILLTSNWTGAPNGNFRENICSEGDLRSRIFGAFVVTFLACLPLLAFSNIYKMV